MPNQRTKKMVFVSLCIAIGLILPPLARMLPIANVGSVLLPMHIPVLICGYVAGGRYGAITGLILPPLTFLLTGMPPLFPVGVSMMFELAAYGLLTGVLYKLTNGKIILSLLGAMLGGRVVYGIFNSIFFGMAGMPFGMEAFIAGGFVTALPGIIIQILLIPPIIHALRQANLIIED
ncbi:ECF transporter S component [Amphibacillus sp. MSJ-3]|uniref:ECF transporter S component n=1 Tax=Amphibacillus sp. MSJ-3 TaxID=2841505 RepID=UPI001C0EFD95|nr:ECF transporter S component [Amphibacillus sp. MSJ-3]MBU5594481.1 ECF transporter S component [Amphibacillus sp. MSJ-3]